MYHFYMTTPAPQKPGRDNDIFTAIDINIPIRASGNPTHDMSHTQENMNTKK